MIGTNSKKANKTMKNLYLPLIKKGSRYVNTSRRSAELIKYASNAFLATKITFINEIANLCEKSQIDVQDVATGMGLDDRIGSRFLRAGPAYGGSCFPKDTKGLVSIADKFMSNLSIVKSVIKYGLPNDTLLNVNIPNLPKKEIRGFKITKQGSMYFSDIFKKIENNRSFEGYWLTAKHNDPDLSRDNDSIAVKEGYVSVTPLHSEQTNFSFIQELSKWDLE